MELGDGSRIRVIPKEERDGSKQECWRSKTKGRSKAVQGAGSARIPLQSDDEDEPENRCGSKKRDQNSRNHDDPRRAIGGSFKRSIRGLIPRRNRGKDGFDRGRFVRAPLTAQERKNVVVGIPADLVGNDFRDLHGRGAKPLPKASYAPISGEGVLCAAGFFGGLTHVCQLDA